MSLLEALIAALLFALSAGASLQIWSQLSMGVIQEERQQQLTDQLDAELAAVEASLRLQSRQQLQPPPCGDTAAALHAQLSERPSAAGIQRQLTVLQADEALLLDLAVDGLPLRRQRLYLPAALGLCSPIPTAPPPAAPVPTGPASTGPVAQAAAAADPLATEPLTAEPGGEEPLTEKTLAEKTRKPAPQANG